MPSTEPLAIVSRFFRAMELGDLNEVARIISDDAKWWVCGLGEIGKEGVSRLQEGLVGATDDRSYTILNQIAAGERVAVEAFGRFVFKDGRKLENSFHIAFTTDGERITAAREYFDTAAVQAFSKTA